GSLRPRHLAVCFRREHAPDVADIDAHLLENLTAHQARLAAAVQAVTFGLGPAACLEAALRLERLERGTQPRLQVAEVRRRGGSKIASAAHARNPPGVRPHR